MDRDASGVPVGSRARLVPRRGGADLRTVSVLCVVVPFRRLRAGIFLEGAGWAAGGSVVAAVMAIAGSVRRARQSAPVTTYGSARWATEPEVRAAGLLSQTGIYLGRLSKQHLRHFGPEHVLCFAPTRSGKGVGLVVPTLLSWPSSAVVHDIKGENWALTAGWRSQFSHCLLFDPTDARSAAYNPLLEVRRGPGRCATSRTSRTSWSIRKARSSAETTGKRRATRCSSAPSCTCSTRKPTRRSPASPPFSRTPRARSGKRSHHPRRQGNRRARANARNKLPPGNSHEIRPPSKA